MFDYRTGLDGSWVPRTHVPDSTGEERWNEWWGSQPGERWGSQPGERWGSQPGERWGSQPGERWGSQLGERWGSQRGRDGSATYDDGHLQDTYDPYWNSKLPSQKPVRPQQRKTHPCEPEELARKYLRQGMPEQVARKRAEETCDKLAGQQSDARAYWHESLTNSNAAFATHSFEVSERLVHSVLLGALLQGSQHHTVAANKKALDAKEAEHAASLQAKEAEHAAALQAKEVEHAAARRAAKDAAEKKQKETEDMLYRFQYAAGGK